MLRGGALDKDKTSSREQAEPVHSKTVEDIKVSINKFIYVGICFSFMNFKISMCLLKDLGIGRDGGSDCSNSKVKDTGTSSSLLCECVVLFVQTG